LANNKVEIKITGEGKIAGIDNGDPRSFNFFKSNSVNLFYGKAMLIVKSRYTKGNLVVEATSYDLKNAITNIKMD
jgi:beta-galactosidase